MLPRAPGPAPVLPPLAFAACLACIAVAAALAHCAVFTALLRHSKTGLNSILIQLAVADFLLLGTTIGPELWSLNSRSWNFGKSGCVAYQGLSVFTSTLSTYFVIAISLHVLTTIRLEEKLVQRRIKRNDRDEDEEIRSSQHSLVANSDSSTPPRTMNVDYRLGSTSLPVTLPVLFVWILALSLSVPEFTLAALFHQGKNIIICTLDSSHLVNVNFLLAVFNLFLPLFILSSICVFVIRELTKNRNPMLDNSDTKSLLKLSLCLICVQVFMCAPRSALRVYSVYSSSIHTGRENPKDFVAKGDFFSVVNLVLGITYLTATLIRPLLCIIILPEIRKNITITRTSVSV